MVMLLTWYKDKCSAWTSTYTADFIDSKAKVIAYPIAQLLCLTLEIISLLPH